MEIPRVSVDAAEFSDAVFKTTARFPKNGHVSMTATAGISPIGMELIRAENCGKIVLILPRPCVFYGGFHKQSIQNFFDQVALRVNIP